MLKPVLLFGFQVLIGDHQQLRPSTAVGHQGLSSDWTDATRFEGRLWIPAVMTRIGQQRHGSLVNRHDHATHPHIADLTDHSDGSTKLNR